MRFPWYSDISRHTSVGSLLAAAMIALTGTSASGQVVPPQALAQFQEVVGNRAEAAIILGGDYGAAGGFYSFKGGRVAELSVSKLGGGGEIVAPKPLGLGDVTWAPVLQGNLGHLNADNKFQNGYLEGNRLTYDVLAVQGGGGVRFYFNEHFSLAPTLSGIYGRTENRFKAENAVGQFLKTNLTGTVVDWTLNSWSIQPALDLSYDWLWGRTTFDFSSRYNFFHTESFESTSPIISVNGGSHTWENKLDVDIPLGWSLFGRELHTGGFFARTELFGGISDGLNDDHIYTVNGRFVMDLAGKIRKVRWAGLGFSYFFADHFSGWSAGLDFRFQI